MACAASARRRDSEAAACRDCLACDTPPSTRPLCAELDDYEVPVPWAALSGQLCIVPLGKPAISGTVVSLVGRAGGTAGETPETAPRAPYSSACHELNNDSSEGEGGGLTYGRLKRVLPSTRKAQTGDSSHARVNIHFSLALLLAGGGGPGGARRLAARRAAGVNTFFFHGGGNATFSGNKDGQAPYDLRHASLGANPEIARGPCRVCKKASSGPTQRARSRLVHVRLDRVLQGLRLGAADAVHLLGALPEVEGRQGPHALDGKSKRGRRWAWGMGRSNG